MTLASAVIGHVTDGKDGAAEVMQDLPDEHWRPLGYTPYPGSLNVLVDPAGRREVRRWHAVRAGEVDYHPAVVAGQRCHARTVHDKRIVELVAPARLRDVLALGTSDPVTIQPARAPTRVIIQAAGGGRRWRNHTGVPKHLVTINGERLIDRTVWLVRGHGIRDVLILSPPGDGRYEVGGATLWPKTPDPVVEADAWLPREVWNGAGRTLWLLGDAYYTSSCLEQILTYDPLDWVWYLRYQDTHWRGWKRSKIILGYSMWPGQHEFFHERLSSLAALQAAGTVPRSAGYDLYRWMAGEPAEHVAQLAETDTYRFHGYPPHTWTPPVQDASHDFDWPKHLTAFTRRFDPERDQ